MIIRIVNVTDLQMITPTTENKKIVVVSNFTATTYRFLDKAPEPGADAPGKGQ